MDSQYEPDPLPPDLSKYLGADGLLHLSTPRSSVLWKLTHHSSGKIKQHLLSTITLEKPDEGKPKVYTFINMYDSSGDQLVDDFLDEDSAFIPFTYEDGTLIMAPAPPAIAIPGPLQHGAVSNTQLLTAMQICSRNTANTQKDIPNVRVWDGDPEGWYSWKENIYTRMIAQGIPFTPEGTPDVDSLTVDHEKQIANLIYQYTKRGNTEDGRRVSLYHMQSRESGSLILSKLLAHYERNNIYYVLEDSSTQAHYS